MSPGDILLPMVIVIPLTAAVSTLRFAGTLLIEPSPSKGLRFPSVALVFQLRAIDRRRIQEKMGALANESLEAVFRTLDKLPGRSG